MDVSLATERKSFLPLRVRSTTVSGSSHIPVVSRPTTPVSMPMQIATAHDTKSSFTIGDRVLVNGLKSGTIRYVGRVQFAHGLFCGIELDEPDGKHDGEVNGIRYFQCKSNCGVFVPNEKVVLAHRERALSIQRTVSRLKPPAMTRSMTMSSSNHQLEPLLVKNPSIQLPDIIPSPSAPSTPEPVFVPKETKATIIEPVESIETDFTDSVSLILHQLQQEPKPPLLEARVSLTISEEGTIEDDDDDDEDEIEDVVDVPSQIEPNNPPLSPSTENTQFVQTDLTCGIDEHITVVKAVISKSTLLSRSNKSLSGSSTSINKLKMGPSESRLNLKKPTPVPTVKKETERRPSVPLIAPRRSLLAPPKVTVPPTNKTNVTPLGSRTKLNSSSSSLYNSQSDLSSPKKGTLPSKRLSDPARALLQSKAVSKEAPATVSRVDFDALEQQSTMQKSIIQSLQTNNERVNKQYQHLLNQFDLMSLFSQYSLTEKEHLQQNHQIQLCRNRTAYYRLKTRMEELRISHQEELANHDQQHRTELEQVKTRHRQQSLDYQQKIEQSLHEKSELESRCSSLQERVDGFLEEMANSEHADLLLTHVDKLEKDRTSLQTVLDLKSQELTQLRTKMNERVFEREDQMALQRRIDMVENRNQDLTCLLRQWQLNEKSVAVERDDLKERVAQLERDNLQLTFANEILLYGARERASSVTAANSIPPSARPRLPRVTSFPSLSPVVRANARLTRSVSWNGITDQ